MANVAHIGGVIVGFAPSIIKSSLQEPISINFLKLGIFPSFTKRLVKRGSIPSTPKSNNLSVKPFSRNIQKFPPFSITHIIKGLLYILFCYIIYIFIYIYCILLPPFLPISFILSIFLLGTILFCFLFNQEHICFSVFLLLLYKKPIGDYNMKYITI